MTHTDNRPQPEDIEVSVVLPCYNEAGNVRPCWQGIARQMDATGRTYEIVFVDDGSTDGTMEEIRRLAREDARVRYVALSRNFGHQNALRAGLAMAGGQAAVTMDADMQHPASLLPRMLELWDEGYEVVNTCREDAAGCGAFKRISSALFYRVINFLSRTELQPGCADFRLTDRKVTDVLRACPEDDLFLRGMVAWCGFRQTVVRYKADNRRWGHTKYPLWRMVSLAADGITAFTVRPLRLGILLSALFVALSAAELAYIGYVALFTTRSVSGWASLATLITVLGAATLFMLGIIGEYIGRMFMQTKRRPAYIVRETNISPHNASPDAS
ncbi:MAG: glycosyltransferase family 2 protein [Clostridium sp.]|nr:glycosyltransferase family 2 protein [Clostridium sp.]